MMGPGHPEFDAQLDAHATPLADIARELTAAEHALFDAVHRRRGTVTSPPPARRRPPRERR